VNVSANVSANMSATVRPGRTAGDCNRRFMATPVLS
jgi:hypothetical protein